MRLHLSKDVPVGVGIPDLIDFATRGISMNRVEIHVSMEKGRPRYGIEIHGTHHGTLNKKVMQRLVETHGLSWDDVVVSTIGDDQDHGWADEAHVPVKRRLEVGPIAPRSEYVIAVRFGARLLERQHPKTHRYPGIKTAPEITTMSWQEDVIALTAHEAFHIREERNGKIHTRNREVRAEKHALTRIEAWRKR